jgi:peptidoglycan hydrolase-like protein with peptidoglycan-binding domain
MSASLAGVSAWAYVERMAYPGQFHRLVLIGTTYTDTFNTTVSIVPDNGSTIPAVTEELIEAVAAPIADWWPRTIASGSGIGIAANVALTGIKLNRIGPDGRYVDAETREFTYPLVIAGSGPGGQAAQLAVACTIRGVNDRQRAGKGRMYMPMNSYSSALGGDGRMLQSNAAALAQRFHTFLQSIDGVYSTASVDAGVGIASRSGVGGFQRMYTVSVGRVIDTIRSRRSALDEAPEYFPIAP